ncbi:hypothetical protein ARHIZOSPH14_32860 [Agromyces rhizosphaerae]|uniref:Uncharacterized protein n=1 Tax=Agromyces rhizosphaerae TaxID=88374 RepID=A0A9W6CYC9_9MICO|nr:hypothetical protein ARHIZOSPH14_32860 [Agromyces rhizosphaerae]
MAETTPTPRPPAGMSVWYFVGSAFAFVAAAFLVGSNFVIGVIAIALGGLLMVVGGIRFRMERMPRREP